MFGGKECNTTRAGPRNGIILTDSDDVITPAAEAAATVPAMGDEDALDALSPEALRLKLEKFEGPFEVLLYLIRSQEIDIFDIPILKVTEQYLAFLEMMREENLDVAGEFLVMAATLIQIKARMLLPVETEEEEEEVEEDDPRLELVEKLLEYRKFRDLSRGLGALQERASDWFGRRVKPVLTAADDEEEYLEVSLYDLVKAIRAMLRFMGEGPIHQVLAEGASVDDKILFIAETLESKGSITWTELARECRSRVEIVCCLLAILELCRMNRVRAHQHHVYGDIRIFPRTPGDEPPLLQEAAADHVAPE